MKRNDWLSAIVTFVWSEEYFTTKVAMGFGDVGYARMKRKLFCMKLTAVRPGDITWAML